MGAALSVTVLALSTAAFGCDFYFNYERVEAPLGAVGEIGTQVQKTHNNCTLPSMESYEIVGNGVQVLERTEWVEVGRNLYEIWVRVSLATLGEGSLTISKDCTKEGEESGLLPVAVLAPTEDGDWAAALSGAYPFELEDVLAVAGTASVDGDRLIVGDSEFAFPLTWPELDGVQVQVYYAPGSPPALLLIVSESHFLRFDHLVEASG